MARVDEIYRRYAQNSWKGISMEFLPPVKNAEYSSHRHVLQSLLGKGPAFADLTYHQQRIIILKEGGETTLTKEKVRVGTDVIAAFHSDPDRHRTIVPHFVCGGFSKQETENGLAQFPYIGIENVFCCRGDENYLVKSGCKVVERSWVPHDGGNFHASDLIRQVSDLRDGRYLNGEGGEPIDLCIGAGAYPEKHADSVSIEDCIRWTKYKQECGADYLILQMCYDNDTILQFREAAISAGITIPIIPGLKILDSLKQVKTLPMIFKITIPDALSERVDASPGDATAIGLEWAVMQTERLHAEGFPIVHLYTMNKGVEVLEYLDSVDYYRNGHKENVPGRD